INDCVSAPSSALSRSALATIARQSGGKRLFAAYDPVEPAAPAPPLLTSTRDSSGVHLSWLPPDNGGSTITKYNIYRGLTSGGEILGKSVGGAVTSYNDTTARPGMTYYYRLSAVNGIGQGLKGNEVSN